MRTTRDLGTRVTIWNVLFLCAALALYAGGVTALLHTLLYAELDRHLLAQSQIAVERLRLEPATGDVRWSGERGAGDYAEPGEGGHWLEVWSTDGARQLTLTTVAPLDLGAAPHGPADLGTRSISTARGPVRLLTRATTIAGRTLFVRVAASEMPTRRLIGMLLAGLGVLFPLVAGAAVAGGFFATRRALAPVARLARDAGRLTAEHLGERLTTAGLDEELGQLAQAFNSTLARLEASFERMRRFTADASHELRTPLTALRTVGEVGVQRARSADELREVVGSMLEETDRLTRLIDAMLTLSRADAGELHLAPQWTPACLLACEAAGQLAVLAEEREQTIKVDVTERLCLFVDRLMFRQALVNLIDNAIKYGPHGGLVRIRVAALPAPDRGLALDVEDNGPGIAPVHREHVFDRFYRVDHGRTPGRGGVGLGLPLVKWVAEAHDGRVLLEEATGGGCRFRIVLPPARFRPKEACACTDPACEALRYHHQVDGCP